MKALLLICLLAADCTAQVIENVNFDNYISPSNNDFTNYFSGNSGLVQVPSGGITGGSLETPDSMSWGNSNAYYCSWYAGAPGFIYNTSIYFKYNSAVVNTSALDRPVYIWMSPSADFNHYLVASVLHNRRLQVISYSWAATSAPAVLVDLNWYRLDLKCSMINADSLVIIAEIFDHGISGSAPGVSVASVSGIIADSVLFYDNMISVSTGGTKNGGAIALDNFHFEGNKGGHNCITSIGEQSPLPAIGYYIADNRLFVTHPYSFVIYNSAGAVLFRSEKNSVRSTIPLLPGIYFISSPGYQTAKVLIAGD